MYFNMAMNTVIEHLSDDQYITYQIYMYIGNIKHHKLHDLLWEASLKYLVEKTARDLTDVETR